MARKAKQRISYVLPLANSTGGHRLGVNGLAVDPDQSILYSGGRDGSICAWDLNLNLKASEPSDAKPPPTSFRQQVQAHTHWINDIALAQNNQAVVTASSDITIKLWRPHAEDGVPPQTIGGHTDYVKCLASPDPSAHWMASGALDRKINLWDLNGAGQTLEILVGDDDNTAKGSVYALGATNSILASGGPDSILRLWDPRTGTRITKFVGHTDNIRDVLIAQDGNIIMTASADQTVKVWSMTAGRCMHTLTMHSDSVWSLYSDHPDLSVFYSSDRSGMVAKSDFRGCEDMDEGLAVAICQEHEGVNTVICSGNHIWTATSSSSINRWDDVDTTGEVVLPENYRLQRSNIAGTRSRFGSPSMSNSSSQPTTDGHVNGAAKNQIPFKSVLRVSNTQAFPAPATREDSISVVAGGRKPSESIVDTEVLVVAPYRNLPAYSIEGQNGLIKHHFLNDRRRVLTLDTAGEVKMWDLLKCVPIKSFGKRHLDDVAPEVNTTESVPSWCQVDTRTGSLTCVLEENYCFDAEVYADEVELEEKIDFREDQRINLGKWILRYLFSNLINEEIKRDTEYRQQLQSQHSQNTQRQNAPMSIQLPQGPVNGWQDMASGPTSASTLRANGAQHGAVTPGLAIGLATPMPAGPHFGSLNSGHLPTTAEEGSDLEKTMSTQSQARNSLDRNGDYFSAAPIQRPAETPSSASNLKLVTSATDAAAAPAGEKDAVPQTPTEPEKEAGKKGGLFGKKLGMNMSMSTFGIKGLKGKDKTAEAPKPAPVEEKADDSDSHSSKAEERVVEPTFLGSIQKIRHIYDDQIAGGQQDIASAITPSLPNETPVLKPPLNTIILIQEDKPESGGVADLFEGQVGTLGQQADLIEKVAPMWLGDVLLRNQIPFKEIVKVSFLLEPYQNQLPAIATDGNNRLNANRMLRAKKILSYIAERIEPQPEQPDPNALKPEEYLELYCNNQRLSPFMTLQTIRTHIWRGGGDVIIYYKANGRKPIMHADSTAQPSNVSATSSAQESENKAT